MPKKVVILIDGQNLYYSLRNLDLREIDINWVKFLAYLLEPEDNKKGIKPKTFNKTYTYKMAGKN